MVGFSGGGRLDAWFVLVVQVDRSASPVSGGWADVFSGWWWLGDVDASGGAQDGVGAVWVESDFPVGVCFQPVVETAQAEEIFFAGAPVRKRDGVVLVATLGSTATPRPAARHVSGFDEFLQCCGWSIACPTGFYELGGAGVGE